MFCPKHPEQQATARFLVQFGRKTRKRFSHYEQAERFLDGLRYEVDQGTFDYRDYLSTKPLSFSNLSKQYLIKKKTKVRKGTFSHIKNYISVADSFFGNTNVKNIQFAQLEDFTDSLKVGNKTKSCYLSYIHDFFTWLYNRKEIQCIPDFPKIYFELGYRKTVDKETQREIIEEVYRISSHVNPKIGLAIKFLSTYISIRPNELRNLKEKDIDHIQGFLFIPHPKEKRPKLVPLIDDDIQLMKTFPPGLPDLYFFRHDSKVKGCPAGSRFGVNIFYKWWKKACDNLGIVDVDLYGGTRHSSAVGLREFATPEEIRRATMHSTNKAFERYYMTSKEELQGVYQATRNCDTGVIRKGGVEKKITG